MANESYGSVWQRASADIAAELDSGKSPGEVLRRVLGLGYFSQFTSYPSADFNAAVVSWLERHLVDRHAFRLSDLPAGLDELDIAPAATIVEHSGRRLSPDLLRNVAYARLLEETWKGETTERTDILEIGSGYGGLVRTLKAFYPDRRYWLTDLPESLRCAEIYLRYAFPDARIAWLDATFQGALPEADFYLVPVQDASRHLAGRSFGLAINVWSFGEMPNEFIREWFRLLQRDCGIAWLFTINSFMAPVTPPSIDRTRIGDWLLRIDERWSIEHFEIDPAVHRCPLIRNFPKGIGLVAKRVTDEAAIERLRAEAARELEAVHREDWARIAANVQSHADPARPERMIEHAAPDWDAVSCRRLITLTDYVGHFNIEAGKDGPFYRLWNDFRINRNEDAGALLAAYLAMAGKTDLESRCTKEELLVLGRLAERALHAEYAAFSPAMRTGKISHEGAWLTDQEACDQATERKNAGDLVAAEALWTKVAAAYPGHGDCWFQIARLEQGRGALPEAAIHAAHAVYLGCPYYAEEAGRIRSAAGVRPDRASPFAKYFGGEQRQAFEALALTRRAAGDEIAAQAHETAAATYR